MHPLQNNLKSLSFEELEKRKSEIHKRMQIMRRSQWHNEEIWHQLEFMLDMIMDEQRERYAQQNESQMKSGSGVVLSTDPLDDDQISTTPTVSNRQFRPVQ